MKNTRWRLAIPSHNPTTAALTEFPIVIIYTWIHLKQCRSPHPIHHVIICCLLSNFINRRQDNGKFIALHGGVGGQTQLPIRFDEVFPVPSPSPFVSPNPLQPQVPMNQIEVNSTWGTLTTNRSEESKRVKQSLETTTDKSEGIREWGRR